MTSRGGEARASALERVSAPGKLVLLGEYAVLEGGPALVAAVNRRAVGAAVSAEGPRERPSAVVAAVLARAERAGLAVEASLEIDTTAFRDASARKLGLGSSAAVAVVAARIVTGSGDERTLGLAIDAHRDAAGGEGSGIDVAASFHGGVIVAHRQPSPVVPLASRVGDLRLFALFTNQSASTPELLARCRAASSYASWVRILRGLAEEGIRAWRSHDPLAFLSAVARHGRAMAGLGRDAGVPIVTPELDAIMRLAEESRVAAKPSGAGGGDVAVLFARDAEVAASIAERTGTQLLDLSIDPRGLSRA